MNKVKSLIVRNQHWVFEAVNFACPGVLPWIFRNIPFTVKLHRFHIFCTAESGFHLFPMSKSAARLRQRRREKIEKYMRETAPAKCHDIPIPDFDVGCKLTLSVIGCYLESLHRDNLLLTDDKILEIVPEGIKTEKRFIPADVIVLATGFQMNRFMGGTVVQGRNGKTFEEHWSNYGGPEVYNCSVMNRFPNLFLLLGPNSATGHTSALMAAENFINYVLRILKPVLEGQALSVEIKREAEDSWSDWKIKRTARKRSQKFRIFGLLALIVLGNLNAAGLQSPLVEVTAFRVWDSVTTYVTGILYH